jgi:hypothetical protein
MVKGRKTQDSELSLVPDIDYRLRITNVQQHLSITEPYRSHTAVIDLMVEILHLNFDIW